MKKLIAAVASLPLALAACGNSAEDEAQDRMEADARASAQASGDAIAALGLTERQLLDADLIGANNVELGDIERVERAADGTVDRLLVEIEDSDPDRYVHVPITGLTTVTRGDDVDVQTTMTAADLAALPEVSLTNQ